MPADVNITQLLIAWQQGDAAALDRLTPFLYDQLRSLAGHYLRRSRPNHTLQPTALVHEAFLELLDLEAVNWQNRAHFINLAARVMRSVLVDHARKRSAGKRGGGAFHVSLSWAERAPSEPAVNLETLNDALDEFARQFPRQAKVIELHFFGGLQTGEIPAVLQVEGFNVSQRTVERDLKFARAWLYQEIGT